MLLGDLLQRVHLASASVELCRHDGGCSSGYRSLYCRRVDEVISSTFHWHRDPPSEMDGRSCGDHGMRTKNHFLAWVNSRSTYCKVETICGIPDSEREFRLQ